MLVVFGVPDLRVHTVRCLVNGSAGRGRTRPGYGEEERSCRGVTRPGEGGIGEVRRSGGHGHAVIRVAGAGSASVVL